MMALLLVLAALSPAIARAQAPAVTTTAATHIAHSAALLTGTLAPAGLVTEYHFEYGPTAAYGSATPSGQVTGMSVQPVSVQVTGLQPGTTYHVRLVATNDGGTLQGADMTFSTLERAPTPAQPSTPPGSGGSRLAGFHARYRLYPDALLMLSFVQDSSPAGWRLTISCGSCSPRIRAAHRTSALSNVRIPKGGALRIAETRPGSRGSEIILRLRRYGTSRAEMLRVVGNPFVRTDRFLPAS